MVLEGLGSGLKKALRKLAGRTFVDRKVLNELAEDLQRALLKSDVEVDLTFDLIKRIKERARNEKPSAGLTQREHILNIVYEELTSLLGVKPPEIKIGRQRILLVGLFGSGKTTTAGKLAKFFQRRGLRPALIGCDIVRPAAPEQLEQVAARAGVPVYIEKKGRNSSKILKNGLAKFKKADVIIVDSSGRDALKKDMINEIKALDEILNPDATLLVIPADLGQQARVQAKAIRDAIGITGIVITRIDGTAKGGGALAACAATGAPVLFIGTGEKIDDLEEYDPTRFVSRLIGLGDLQSLLQKAKEAGAEARAEKIAAGRFTLVDFCEQIQSIQQMGPLTQMIEMIPGLGRMKIPTQALEIQEARMSKWKYIIDSMTPEERAGEETIDANRVVRIARGSGTTESEVRELLKNYNQVKKLMRMAGGKKFKRGPFAQLARQLGMGALK